MFKTLKNKGDWPQKKHISFSRRAAVGPTLPSGSVQVRKNFWSFWQKNFFGQLILRARKKLLKEGRKDISHFRVVSRILIARCFIWQAPYLPHPSSVPCIDACLFKLNGTLETFETLANLYNKLGVFKLKHRNTAGSDILVSANLRKPNTWNTNTILGNTNTKHEIQNKEWPTPECSNFCFWLFLPNTYLKRSNANKRTSCIKRPSLIWVDVRTTVL